MEEHITTAQIPADAAFAGGWEEGVSTDTAFTEGWEEGISPDAAPDGADTGTGEDGFGDIALPEETAAEHAAEKTWTLRHLDEERAVSEEELVTLAQKGLDYDRIRTRYDAGKSVMARLAGLAQSAGVSVQDYVEGLQTEIPARPRSGALPTRSTAAADPAAERERRIRADIEDFRRTFPDALDRPVPEEVWQQVRGGATLTAAYAAYALAQERAARRAAELGIQNARRSTGSLRSAGEETAGRDAFLEGWEMP